MELKSDITVKSTQRVMSSNRTFMELKCFGRRKWKLTEGSNRTFMELKCITLECKGVDIKSSNRTFMELKCDFIAGHY